MYSLNKKNHTHTIKHATAITNSTIPVFSEQFIYNNEFLFLFLTNEYLFV
jgi:hypothetical protein